MKKTILGVFLYFIFIIYCFGQDYPLSDFKEIPIPKLYSKEWSQLNDARISFSVSITDGKLAIGKSKTPPETFEFEIPEGKLIGQREGEAASGVFFLPKDLSKKKYYVNGELYEITNDLIKKDSIPSMFTPLNKIVANLVPLNGGNIISIFYYKSKLCFIEGLAHMTLSYGSFRQISFHKDAIEVLQLFDFESAPMVVYNYKGKIYIATDKGFCIINNFKKEVAWEHIGWTELDPTSIAIANGKNIYVGLRGGYAKLNPTTKEIHLYKYNK